MTLVALQPLQQPARAGVLRRGGQPLAQGRRGAIGPAQPLLRLGSDGDGFHRVRGPGRRLAAGRQRGAAQHSVQIATVGQAQTAQRIVGQGIGPGLHHHHLGRKGAGGGDYHPVDQQRQLRIAEPFGHRQVEGGAAAIVQRLAGEGPPVALVNRNQPHARLPRQCGLYPVAVMGVQIHIENPPEAIVQQAQNPQNRIVEIAEAAGPVGPAMVGAARRAVDQPRALGQQIGRQDTGPGGGGRAAIHFGENRVAAGADLMARAGFGIDGLHPFRRRHRRDVIGVVEAGQLIRRCHRAVDILIFREPAKRADQVQRGTDPRDRQRMLGAIGRAAINLSPDQDRPVRIDYQCPIIRRVSAPGYTKNSSVMSTKMGTRIAADQAI